MRTPSLEIRKTAPGMEAPGAFQCQLLRAFELHKVDRDVFLLKEIQGLALVEISTILGITVDTALSRLKRAYREMGRAESSDALEREG